MNDYEIYRLLLKDSDRGLNEVIKKYYPYVKAIVSRILINRRQDIEECIADTFISVWKRKNSIEVKDGSMKGLIACIARNTAINRYNLLKKEQLVETESDIFTAEDEIESLIENIYQDEVVETILSGLKGEHKEIFLRRHVLMESVEEIAADMKMNERQIRNSLYRSKMKLKEALKQNEKSAIFEWRNDL